MHALAGPGVSNVPQAAIVAAATAGPQQVTGTVRLQIRCSTTGKAVNEGAQQGGVEVVSWTKPLQTEYLCNSIEN